MFLFLRRAAILSVVAVALAASSACALYAQSGRGYSGGPVYGGAASAAQVHFDRGYYDGVRQGERDLLSRDRFNYRDERGWRRAPSRAYREGFERGYADGYRRADGRYGRGDRYGRDGRYGDDSRYGDDRYGRRGGYSNLAAERGFRDGYDEGRKDARDRDRYDPVRSKKYRSADDGYDRRYGSRDQWKAAYRAAFREGYERGYREGRYREN